MRRIMLIAVIAFSTLCLIRYISQKANSRQNERTDYPGWESTSTETPVEESEQATPEEPLVSDLSQGRLAIVSISTQQTITPSVQVVTQSINSEVMATVTLSPTHWVPLLDEAVMVLDPNNTVQSLYNLDLENPFENSEKQFIGDLQVIITNEEHNEIAIIPLNEAQVVKITNLTPSFDECELALAGRAESLIEDISEGDSLCFLTDEGRISHVLVEHVFTSPTISIWIHYKTWRPTVGSHYFEILGNNQ